MGYLDYLKASAKQEVKLKDLVVPFNEETINIWIISFSLFILLLISI